MICRRNREISAAVAEVCSGELPSSHSTVSVSVSVSVSVPVYYVFLSLTVSVSTCLSMCRSVCLVDWDSWLLGPMGQRSLKETQSHS